MKRLFLLLLLALSPSLLAQAFFQIDPLVPKEGDVVEVRFGGSWGAIEVPKHPRVSIDGKTITIDLDAPPLPPLSVVAPWGERVNLGRLDDGTHTVIVRVSDVEIGRHTITVAPRTLHVSPSFGGGHTPVLIEGVPLDDCREPSCVRVTFGTVPALAVQITPEGQIIATAPIGVTGTVDVNVTVGASAPFTQYTQPNAFHFGVVDPQVGMTRVLFPINFYGRGAHGSEWYSDIIVRNDGPVEVPTEPLFWANPHSPVLPIPTPIEPGGRGNFPQRPSDGGAFLWIARDLEKYLSYSLHAVDRSRSEVDRGTEIPVVRAEDTSSFVRILNVPTAGRYRAKLRIYNFDLENGERVEIRLHHAFGGEPTTLYATLNGVPVCPAPPCIADRPAFAAIDLPQLTSGPVDITIRAETNDVRLWGFVSVTNNETQHVTVYTPQHGSER